MTSAKIQQGSWALHAPAEARRAFRDLDKSGGGEAAGMLAGATGRGLRAVLFGSRFLFFACFKL